MNTTIRALVAASLVVGAFSLAVAKLPAPPPMTDQQKAEKAAKDKAAADHDKALLEKGAGGSPHVVWKSVKDGTPIVYASEPGDEGKRELLVDLYDLLPIEDQL